MLLCRFRQISLTDGELEVGAGHVTGTSRFLRATVPIVQGAKCDCLFVGFAGVSQAVTVRYLPPRELCGREVFPPIAGPASITLLEKAAETHSARAQTQTRKKAQGDADEEEESDSELTRVLPVTAPPLRARAQQPANDRAAQDL